MARIPAPNKRQLEIAAGELDHAIIKCKVKAKREALETVARWLLQVRAIAPDGKEDE